MSQRYPCPNPTCTHEFTPQDLAGVASVTCPHCGMMIQLRTAAAASAPLPALPPLPVEPDVAEAEVPEPIAVGPIVRARARRGSRDIITYSMAIGGFVLLVAAVFVGLYIHDRGGVGKLLGDKGGYKNSDFNFSFNPGVAGWEQNPGMKNKLKVNQLALQRKDGQGVFAVDALDFKDHNPTPRELDSEARNKLRAFFNKNLETEPGRNAPLAETEAVAGQAAHRITFLGETPEKTYAGEVVFFGQQGLGYWLYTFAPEAEAKALEAEFKQLRQSLALLGEREEWKRMQQRRTVFTGESINDYELSDSTGRWKKAGSPKDYDAAADLALTAIDPAEPKKPTLGAELLVLSLKAGKDPIEMARDHILAKHKSIYPETKIADAGQEGEEPKDRVGDGPGQVLKLRINHGGGHERFAVMGVVPRGDKLLVLYGECPWGRRVNWESQLQQLIESLHLKE